MYNKKVIGLCIGFFVLILVIGALGLGAGCAKPLADANTYAMEPISRIISSDPNTIYYGIKWAFNEAGLPLGPEDLAGGVIESKWISVGAGSHYVDVFNRKDYGATDGAYYKMVVRITPGVAGGSKVEATTKVKSLVMNVKTTGDKEREVLNKIAEHSRGYSINVTNLGVEE